MARKRLCLKLTYMTKLHTIFCLFIHFSVSLIIIFRFKLSLDAKNIVPVDDLIPELILRAKKGIRVNISPRV